LLTFRSGDRSAYFSIGLNFHPCSMTAIAASVRFFTFNAFNVAAT
jgi:hypothetical protein